LVLVAVAAVALGPKGQRPVNAVMLGAGAFAAAFFGLRGVAHPWLAGGAAVIAGVVGLALGAVAETWGTAALMAASFAAAAGTPVALLEHAWLPVAAVAGSIGLFVGITRQRSLELVLPPMFGAAFAALGLSIGFAPNNRGAALPWLLEVWWVLGLAAVLAVPFLALSMVRERVRVARLEARTRAMDDEDLKVAIAERQEEYERAAQEQAAQEAHAALERRDPQGEPEQGG
jgi:hypothetical protein